MTRYIFTLLFVFSVQFAHAQQTSDNTFRTFNKNHFSIQYPSHWQLDTTGLMGSQVFIFSPLNGPDDKIRENVNVLIQNLGGQNIDLLKYKDISERQTGQILTDGKLIESKIVKSNGLDQYQMVYEMTQGQFRLKAFSACFIADGKAYLATFTAEASQYEEYRETLEKIIDSFILN